MTVHGAAVSLTSGAALLQANKLMKRFNHFTAVDGISFTVRPGEVFGLLGSNGAGKTTTVNMCAGLLRPTSGTVRIRGLDVRNEARVAKRLIGYVPDQPYLYDKLTGREFVTFMGRLYGGTKVKWKVESLLDHFNLTDMADELIGAYSHGTKQKVALAGVLVHDPMLLFLDEPTVGLDPRGARLLKDTVHNLAAQGRAVVMCTHILDIAETICHRVAILHQGQIIGEGTVDELRRSVRGERDAGLEDIFLQLTATVEQPPDRLFQGETA